METYTYANQAGPMLRDHRILHLSEHLGTYKSKKQNLVTRASVEIEFRAMTQGVYETI